MVYADIGPNTATKADKLPISLHDDKVQYAELKQNQTEKPKYESKSGGSDSEGGKCAHACK